MKKGSLTIQFNWILVLLAGAVILLFFMGVIQYATQIADQKRNILIGTTLDSISNSIKSGDNLDKPIESIPNINVEYQCASPGEGSNCKCSFIVGDRQFDIDDPSLIVFSPSRMKSPKVLVKSLEWDAPFRTANFLYFTSTSVRYIFILDQTSAGGWETDVLNSTHRDLKKEVYDASETNTIKSKNDDRVKFIFLNINPDSFDLSEFESMNDADVTAVAIAGDEFGGQLSYYQKKGSTLEPVNPSTSLSYRGFPFLLGGIFTDETSDSANFQCNQKRAYETLHYVANDYFQRMNVVETIPDSTDFCKTLYATAKDHLGSLSDALATSYQSDLATMNDAISTSITILDDDNKEAIANSCVPLY